MILSENKLYGYAGCNPDLVEDLDNIPKEEHENWMAVYPAKHVKEFLKELFYGYKFKIIKIKDVKYIKVEDYVNFVNFADKLAGKELTK